MKKVIILTLSFIFSLSIYGQNILTATSETWTSGAWANQMKQNNTYDGSGYLTYNLTQAWDVLSSSWKNNSQINYTNNGNGTVQQYTTQSWDTPSSSWINSQRAAYTYNGANKVLTVTIETWASGSWVNFFKQNYTYDINNNQTYYLAQTWDNPSSSWKNNSQINYTNNGNGTVLQYIAQSWDTPSTSWINSQRITYTYSNSTGIYEANETAFHLFPNPSNDVLNLSVGNNSETKIEIIDLQGTLILSKLISESSAIIDIKDLPSSFYFLHIQQGNKVSVAKFIKN
jgi:hypothetical protein